MAKAIKKYENGLSIRFLKKTKKYYITFGVDHIRINGAYSNGFTEYHEAEKTLLALVAEPLSNYKYTLPNQ